MNGHVVLVDTCNLTRTALIARLKRPGIEFHMILGADVPLVEPPSTRRRAQRFIRWRGARCERAARLRSNSYHFSYDWHEDARFHWCYPRACCDGTDGHFQNALWGRSRPQRPGGGGWRMLGLLFGTSAVGLPTRCV